MFCFCALNFLLRKINFRSRAWFFSVLLCLMPSPPVSPQPPAAQASAFPQSQTDVFPGAWPLEHTTSISPNSQSQSTPHLDRVLSFHKRFSLSFSSPILMPARSPLLSPSVSEPAGFVISSEVRVRRANTIETELTLAVRCRVILARHLYLF